MGRRRGFGKIKKPKVAPFDLIDHTLKPLPEPYKLMESVRKEHHPDISDAKIALAWRKGTKEDKDGHLTLGRCMKASDLQRELVDWDFVIILNFEAWAGFDKPKKLALLDHELMHADQAVDKDGEPKVDPKGRKVWRIRKHDVEEFSAIVKRHGIWKRDLEQFAEALLKQKQRTLFPLDAKVEPEKPAEAAATVQ